MLFGITHSFPWLFRTPGYITTRYSPFRRFPGSIASYQTILARLACLIHAANVHSEPGSNPSIGYIHQPNQRPKSPTQLKSLLKRLKLTSRSKFALRPASLFVRSCAGFSPSVCQESTASLSEERRDRDPRPALSELSKFKRSTHQIVKEQNVILVVCRSKARPSSDT